MENDDLELVLQTGSATLVAVLRSVLESEEIPHVIRGDGVQDLFGLGRLAAGFNFIVGPIQVLVPSDQVERVHEILAQLDRPAPEDAS